MPKQEKETEEKPCSCTQAAVDLLKGVSPLKDGMLREVKCKSCGKTFLTNFDTDYCFDCTRETLKK
jgi:uncharacterized OB-fold protein